MDDARREIRDLCGVVVICTDDQGRVIATVTDFSRQGPGGFKMREAQSMRARRAINRAVCNAYCSPSFAAAIEDYHLEATVRRLCERGWKVTEIPVGDDPTDNRSPR